jgi:hypothetical protein
MYIRRTGSSGATEGITRYPRESEVRSPVVRHERGGCIFFSRFLYAQFFSGYVMRSIVRMSVCGDVSFKLSFYPFKIQCMTFDYQIYRTGTSLRVLSFSSFRSTSPLDSHTVVSHSASLA